MKICILSDFYFPNARGGGEEMCRFMAEGLAKRGFDVHIITPNLSKDSYEIEKKGKLTIHRYRSPLRRFVLKVGKKPAGYLHTFPSTKTSNKESKIFNFFHFFYRKYSAMELARAFKKINKKERFNLLHANNVEPIIALNYIKNIPITGHIRDFHLFNNKVKKDIPYIAINEKAMMLARGFENVKVIYDPIMRSKISSIKKRILPYENICLFAGHFSPRSNTSIIEESAIDNPDVEFIICGEGHHNLKNIKNIHLMGNVKNIKDYYKSADLLLYLHDPGWGIGLVPLEAMANGLPVMSYKFENCKFPFLMYKREEMSKAIKDLFKDKSRLKKLGKSCSVTIEEYSEENILNQLERFFKNVINKTI